MKTLKDKKICLVLTSLKSGGLEKNAALLANHFVSICKEVKICCLYSNECFFELDKRINVVDFSTKKHKLLSINTWIKQLKKFFIENDIDSVISFGDRAGFIVSKAISNKDINHICRGVNSKKNLINKILLSVSCDNIDHFVFQTTAQSNLYSKKIREKGIVIPNPFDLYKDNFNNDGVNSKRFITIASFKLKQKRFDDMINAFSIFVKNHNDYTFEIYGRYEQKAFNHISNLNKSLNLEDKIIIKGECKDIKTAIIPSRAFVCASSYEGMPNALIESLSYGIPVISSNWLGYDEIIDNNVNGLIFKIGDVKHLANLMESIANDETFNNLSKKGFNHKINEFGKEKVFKTWDEII